MKRQQYLKHRLHTLGALRDAVGAMRSLSAHHFCRARKALSPARQYRVETNSVIAEIGIHQALHIGAPASMLVIASDLGLCGDYNSRLSHMAVTEAKSLGIEKIYSVGRRARTTLAKNALAPFRTYHAPASLDGISQVLLGLAKDIFDDYLELRIGSLHIVSAGFEGVGHFSPLSARVLPIQPVSGEQPLARSPYIEPNHLTMVAVREFLYITLYEILLDSLAAEHGMRLMAAEAALEWLDNTSAITARRLSTTRSEAATQELLDIIAGGRHRSRRE